MGEIVSAIILAAGVSKRFLGGKLVQRILVEGKEYSLIKYIVEKFKSVKEISEVVVVIGHDKLRIMESISDPEVKFVYNPDYHRGMSYSVRAGVRSIIRYCDIAIIHPGDVVFVKTDTLRKLVAQALLRYWRGDGVIILPRYRGKGGHPLIVTRPLLKYVLSINEETRGLKGFLNRFRDNIVYINTDDLGVVYDIDMPDDLEAAEEKFGIKWVRK